MTHSRETGRPAPPTFGRVWLTVQADTGDLEEALGEAQAQVDDRRWSWYVFQPFTWQRFTDWWAARKYVMPRDVRKR